MRLSCAGNQKFIGLRIAKEPDKEILFHQLVNCGRQLVFIRAALGLNGVCHGRFRQRCKVNLDIGALRSQRVAGQRLAQLGHRTQIARVQFRNFNSLASLHDAQVREALLPAPRIVLERRIVLHHAADDLEEGDAPRKGIAHRLEDHQSRGFAIIYFAESRVAACARIATITVCCHGLHRSRLHRDRRALSGRRRIHLDEVQQMVGRYIRAAAGKQAPGRCGPRESPHAAP